MITSSNLQAKSKLLVLIAWVLGVSFINVETARADLPGPKLRYALTFGPSSYYMNDISALIHLSEAWTLTPGILFGKTSSKLTNSEFDLAAGFQINSNHHLSLDLRFYRDETSLKSNIAKLTYEYALSSLWNGETQTTLAFSFIGRRDTEPGFPTTLTTTQGGFSLSLNQELSEDWTAGLSATFYGLPNSDLVSTTFTGRRNGRGRAIVTDGSTTAGDFTPSSGFEKYSQSFFVNGWILDNTSAGISIGRYAYFGDSEATWSFTPNLLQDFDEHWSGELAWSYQKAPTGGANYVTVGATYHFD